MSEALLDQEELEFLLQQSDEQVAEEIPDPLEGEDTSKVTIRGDLVSIALADIFQTLSMSKMRGILKVYNPLETRLIYFDEDGIRLMYPSRSETRRIGQRLVRCGLVKPAQLRKALIAQKKSYRPLGELLVQAGYATEDDLSAVLNNQLEEDLHGIFTWQSGDFEFYKNKPEDSFMLEQLRRTPRFQVNPFLLEAARRADEWSQILDVIGSVHAVPVFSPDVEFPKMDGDELTLCEAIDDYSTVTDLAEVSLLGLFNASKALCSLERQGLVEIADPDFTLTLAADAANKNEFKRALHLCQYLKTLAIELNFGQCTELADVLDACKEPRLGAEILLECAESLIEPEQRLEVARRAQNLGRNSIPVMRFLRTQFAAAERTDDPDYLRLLNSLCDALSETGEDEDALEIFAEVEKFQPGDSGVLMRKARLLHRSGDDEPALAVLLELRTAFEEEGDRDRLIKLYEQILKINRGQRDVARALRVLRLGKTRTRQRRIAGAATVAVLLLGAWFTWSWVTTSEQIESAVLQVRSKIETLSIAEARKIVAEAEMKFGHGEIWAELKGEIDAVATRVKMAERAEKDKANHESLDEVAAEFEKSNLAAGLAIYAKLLKKPDTAGLVRKTAPGQFHLLSSRLQGTLDALREDLPGPPSTVAGFDTLLASHKILEQKMKIDTTLASRLLGVRGDKTLETLWSATDLQRAFETAREILQDAKTVESITLEYVRRIEKLEKHQRLGPVYKAAEKAELAHDFATAEKLYKQLFAEFRGNAELGPRFRDLVTKYAAINKHLGLLKSAVARHNFREARAYYRHLKASHQEYPWNSMIKLPLKVVTTPPGADIWFNGKLTGKAPLDLEYLPSVKNRIEVRLEGFHPEQAQITDDAVGLVRSILNRVPQWVIPTDGVVEKRPVAGSGNQLFLVDRRGNVSSWSTKNRKRLWVHNTRDISGLLTRPVLWENLAIVGSLDGTLRVFDQAKGSIAWTIENMPCESTPVIYRSTLALVSKKKLLFYDLVTRKQLRSIDVGARVRRDLFVVRSTVLVATDAGILHGVDLRSGNPKWKPIRLESGIVNQPSIHEGLGIFSTDEGWIATYDLVKGRRLWRHSGLGELRWRPTTNGKLVYVAAPPTPKNPARVLSFDLRSGKPGPQFKAPPWAIWSGHLARIGDHILVGSRSGIYWVLDATTLELRYWIRGKGAASAQPIAMPGGEVLCPFYGKQILVFPGLR